MPYAHAPSQGPLALLIARWRTPRFGRNFALPSSTTHTSKMSACHTNRRPERRHTPSSPRLARATLGVAGVTALIACGGGARASSKSASPSFVFTDQASGSTALLQAISIVDSNTVWVSGHAGTYARTTDGGATWHAAVVPGADSLQFRDVEAVSADTAFLMSAGDGALSRVYKTVDAGATWQLQYTNPVAKGFYDCMAFWDSRHGIVMSDEVDGRFPMIATSDGVNWTPVPRESLPAALPGEGSFASSGSCVVARASGRAWIGTGNSTATRVLHTTDGGATWSADSTPLPSGEGVGIGSVAFRDDLHGAAMGGSMLDTSARGDNIAFTSDGGVTWATATRAPLRSAIYGGSYVPGAEVPTLVVVGPGGAAATSDAGRSWSVIDSSSYWAVAFASPRAGWAVGPRGVIRRLGGQAPR